ncbi:Proline-rich receptor-like protein kinase PERK5 [Bienertia sinuspersici]
MLGWLDVYEETHLMSDKLPVTQMASNALKKDKDKRRRDTNKNITENPPGAVRGNHHGEQPQQRHQQNNNPPKMAEQHMHPYRFTPPIASPLQNPPTPLSSQSSSETTNNNSLPLPQQSRRSPTPQYPPTYISSGKKSSASESEISSIPPASLAFSYASPQTMFTYNDLAMATNGFSRANFLILISLFLVSSLPLRASHAINLCSGIENLFHIPATILKSNSTSLYIKVAATIEFPASQPPPTLLPISCSATLQPCSAALYCCPTALHCCQLKSGRAASLGLNEMKRLLEQRKEGEISLTDEEIYAKKPKGKRNSRDYRMGAMNEAAEAKKEAISANEQNKILTKKLKDVAFFGEVLEYLRL